MRILELQITNQSEWNGRKSIDFNARIDKGRAIYYVEGTYDDLGTSLLKASSETSGRKAPLMTRLKLQDVLNSHFEINGIESFESKVEAQLKQAYDLGYNAFSMGKKTGSQ